MLMTLNWLRLAYLMIKPIDESVIRFKSDLYKAFCMFIYCQLYRENVLGMLGNAITAYPYLFMIKKNC